MSPRSCAMRITPGRPAREGIQRKLDPRSIRRSIEDCRLAFCLVDENEASDRVERLRLRCGQSRTVLVFGKHATDGRCGRDERLVVMANELVSYDHV